MKKIITIIIIGIILTMPNQLEGSFKLSVGLPISSAFGDITNQWDNDGHGKSSFAGFQIGASYVRYYTDNIILLEPGLRFISRGHDFSCEHCGDGSVVVNSVDAFLNIKFNTNRTGDFKAFSVYPYVGIAPSLNISFSGDDEDHFKSNNMYLLLGTDLLFMERVALGIEYNIGLNSILNDHEMFYNTMMMSVKWRF